MAGLALSTANASRTQTALTVGEPHATDTSHATTTATQTLRAALTAQVGLNGDRLAHSGVTTIAAAVGRTRHAVVATNIETPIAPRSRTITLTRARCGTCRGDKTPDPHSYVDPC